MSVASLNATIATLEAKGIPYRLETSPVTGNLEAYTQTITPTIMPPGSNVDLEASVVAIDTNVKSQIDGFCDNIGYIGGVLSETYYPSIWAATTSLNGELYVIDKDGNVKSLLTPNVIIAIILAVASVFIAALVVGYLVWSHQMYAYQDDSGDIVTTPSWTEFMSRQNAKYWFVCGKDGYGVGLRSQYAQASDVPEAEVQRWQEHCDQAADLSEPDTTISNIIWAIALGAVLIGGVYIAAKVVPGLMKKPEA